MANICYCKANRGICNPSKTDECPASTTRLLYEPAKALQELHEFEVLEYRRQVEVAHGGCE